jgi:Spy/CpxP family protein refolding chaperone
MPPQRVKPGKLSVKKVKPLLTSKTPAPAAASIQREIEFTMQTKTKLMILASLFPAALLAQRPFGVLTSATPPDPATLVANQVARLTSLLSLTTEQQAQATTIFTNAANAISPLQTTIRTDYISLQAAVKSNATSTIDQLSSTIGSLYGQIVDIQNKADAAFYAILTSSQQTTLGNTPFGGFGPFVVMGPGPGGPPPGN